MKTTAHQRDLQVSCAKASLTALNDILRALESVDNVIALTKVYFATLEDPEEREICQSALTRWGTISVRLQASNAEISEGKSE
jgi:hypothetical protein